MKLNRPSSAIPEFKISLRLLSSKKDQEDISIADLGLGTAYADQRGDDLAVTYLLAASTGFSSRSNMKALALQQLAISESKLARHDDAVKHLRVIFALAQGLKNADLQNKAISTADELYEFMFHGISWNVISGREREAQEADFVNNGDVGSGGAKYGRRSPDEDLATFGTFLTRNAWP
jgi:hypothetical protein